MPSTLFCIVSSEAKAGDIVSRLKSSGVLDTAISVLFPDRTGTHNFPEGATRNTPAPPARAAISGPLGLLAGIGFLPLPGVGPFIGAGPLLTSLRAMPLGVAFTGISGALVDLGLPQLDARRYETSIRDGLVLIADHSAGVDAARNARDIFEKSGAADIAAASEEPAPPLTPAPPAFRAARKATAAL